MRILLVDDHTLFAEALKSLLECNGFDIVGIAGNGYEALEKVRLLKPDVVLMDDEMPHCNGVEASRLIKAEFPEVKVVMLATSADNPMLLEAVKSGVTGYLTKSTDPKEFLQLLAGVARGEAAMTREITTRIVHAFADSAQKMANTSLASSPKRSGESTILSQRQVEVLRFIAEGNKYKAIAAALAISERTVNYHINEILNKLHVQTPAQAIVYATHHNLINADHIASPGK